MIQCRVPFGPIGITQMLLETWVGWVRVDLKMCSASEIKKSPNLALLWKLAEVLAATLTGPVCLCSLRKDPPCPADIA